MRGGRWESPRESAPPSRKKLDFCGTTQGLWFVVQWVSGLVVRGFVWLVGSWVTLTLQVKGLRSNQTGPRSLRTSSRRQSAAGSYWARPRSVDPNKRTAISRRCHRLCVYFWSWYPFGVKIGVGGAVPHSHVQVMQVVYFSWKLPSAPLPQIFRAHSGKLMKVSLEIRNTEPHTWVLARRPCLEETWRGLPSSSPRKECYVCARKNNPIKPTQFKREIVIPSMKLKWSILLTTLPGSQEVAP